MPSIQRLVLLAVAALVVAAGAFYLFVNTGSDSPAADDSNPIAGTPLPDLPGAPTAVPGTGPIGPERPEVGQPAPDFALLDVFDGTTVHKLSDFKGTPVVLNWYASWCGPCQEELPVYEQASTDLDGQVAFFGVNLLETQGKAQGILEDLGITFPTVLDPTGSVSDRWRVSLMPTTFFINADGVLVSENVGQVTKEVLATHLAELGVTYTP